MSSFKNLRIVDNFYQTSAFFPMPTVLVGTLAEDNSTSLGPYSLVQPYYIAGKGYYAMLLCCRNSSNTAQHLLARGKCSLNFIPDDKKIFKELVKLSWPGDTPEEKMKDCKFTLEEGLMGKESLMVLPLTSQVYSTDTHLPIVISTGSPVNLARISSCVLIRF